jgi:hypothetical protein
MPASPAISLFVAYKSWGRATVFFAPSGSHSYRTEKDITATDGSRRFQTFNAFLAGMTLSYNIIRVPFCFSFRCHKSCQFVPPFFEMISYVDKLPMGSIGMSLLIANPLLIS